ncbi:MAG: T9SS type A sorting domain-containing protein [Bacteroidales bacterium]|jgi:hypothetical protein|nr:T9SS type A sorting domain-containing protein [Bacteroidales bacterium]
MKTLKFLILALAFIPMMSFGQAGQKYSYFESDKKQFEDPWLSTTFRKIAVKNADTAVVLTKLYENNTFYKFYLVIKSVPGNFAIGANPNNVVKTSYVTGYKSIEDIQIFGDYVYFCGTKTIDGVDKGFINRMPIKIMFNNPNYSLDYVDIPSQKGYPYPSIIIEEANVINKLAIYDDGTNINIIGAGRNRNNPTGCVVKVLQSNTPLLVGNGFGLTKPYNIASLGNYEYVESLAVTNNYIATVGHTNDYDAFIVRRFPKTSLTSNLSRKYVLDNTNPNVICNRAVSTNTGGDNIAIACEFVDKEATTTIAYDIIYRLNLSTMQLNTPLRMSNVVITDLASDNNGTLFAARNNKTILRINNVNASPTQATVYPFDQNITSIDYKDGLIKAVAYTSPSGSSCNDIFIYRKDINRTPNITNIITGQIAYCWQPNTLNLSSHSLPAASDITNVSSTQSTSTNKSAPLNDNTQLTLTGICLANEIGSSKFLIQQIDDNITIYPNPARDYIDIASPADISKVEIYNMLGQKVYAAVVGINKATINVGNFVKGNYIVKIFTDESIVTKQFIKN